MSGPFESFRPSLTKTILAWLLGLLLFSPLLRNLWATCLASSTVGLVSVYLFVLQGEGAGRSVGIWRQGELIILAEK